MKTSSILIRVSEEEKSLFKSEADKEDMSLSDWIRFNLNIACESQLDRPLSKAKKITVKPAVGLDGKPDPQIVYDGTFESKVLIPDGKEMVRLKIVEEQKCCVCPLAGKHYARNRWFCDAHRP